MAPRTILSILTLAALAGCTQPLQHPPLNVDEYTQMQKEAPGNYPEPTILMINRQRMMDKDLPVQDRVDSLKLVDKLAGDTQEVRDELGVLVSDSATPQEIRNAVIEVIIGKNYSEMSGLLVQALPSLKSGDPLEKRARQWLSAKPAPGVLSEIVKLWAAKPANGPEEARYIQLIEQFGGQKWDVALLQGMDSEGYNFAVAPALKVLLARLTPEQFAERLLKFPAQSDTLKAVQAFFGRFDCLPTSQPQLEWFVQMYTQRGNTLENAGQWYRQWREDGYVFNIRDLHLLDRLANDPTRTAKRRVQLVSELTQLLSAREHVHAKSAADDNFASNAGKLTMADLWNIFLLQEMLNRPRVQAGLAVMAQKDLEDIGSAWGGLVTYKGAAADAMLYRGQGGQGDQEYVPSEKMIADSQDSLCRFIAHFDKVENSLRAGPTPRELADAKQGNFYGLTLTSVNADNFCAHYYNPQGVVISLGVFPFQHWPAQQ